MHSIKTKHNINAYKFKPFFVSFMTAKKELHRRREVKIMTRKLKGN